MSPKLIILLPLFYLWDYDELETIVLIFLGFFSFVNLGLFREFLFFELRGAEDSIEGWLS